MEEYDFILAQQLQEGFDNEYTKENNAINNNNENELSTYSQPHSVIDPSWEVTDPNPDVRALFVLYNEQYFWGKLVGVEVRWSPRMTLCAGVCSYEGRGGLCSIRLSVPLLKLRPRKDLVETLLHEMIHAYLFITDNDRDRDGHGPNFQKHMNRINKASGANITIYHDFHDEVDNYRQHWWRCDGPCRNRPPYYGWVKRSMNRAPSANDIWWKDHAHSCGGSYTKVKEPEGYGEKKKGKKEKKSNSSNSEQKSSNIGMDIRSFMGKGNVLGKPEWKNDSTRSTSSAIQTIGTNTSSKLQSSNFSKQQQSNSVSGNNTCTSKQETNKQTDVGSSVHNWGGGIWSPEKTMTVSSLPGMSPKKIDPAIKTGNSVISGTVSGSGSQLKTWRVVETDKDKATRALVSGQTAGEEKVQDTTGRVLGNSSGHGLSWLARIRREWAVRERDNAKLSASSTQEKAGASSNVSLVQKMPVEPVNLKVLGSTKYNSRTEESVDVTDGQMNTENESVTSGNYSSHDSFHVSSCEEDGWPTPEKCRLQTKASMCQAKKKRTVLDLLSSDEEDCVSASRQKRVKSATTANSDKPLADSDIDSMFWRVHRKDKLQAGHQAQTTDGGDSMFPSIRNTDSEAHERKAPYEDSQNALNMATTTGISVSSGASSCGFQQQLESHVVLCPVCQSKVPAEQINVHLDSCLNS